MVVASQARRSGCLVGAEGGEPQILDAVHAMNDLTYALLERIGRYSINSSFFLLFFFLFFYFLSFFARCTVHDLDSWVTVREAELSEAPS